MAAQSIPISQLPLVATPTLSDIIPAVNGGVTGQETLTQLNTLFGNNIQLASSSQVTGLVTSGTFLPTIQFGGIDSIGATYSVQIGQYTKISNVVFAYIKILLTNKGSSTGQASIGHLPFNCGANQANFGAMFPQYINLNGNQQIYGYCQPSTNSINLIYGVSNGNDVLYEDTDFANNSGINIMGIYFTT
jgi:hypothetical protein